MKNKIEAIIKNYSSIQREAFLGKVEEVGEDVVFALDTSFSYVINLKQYSDDAFHFVDSVIDNLWERLNIGNWKDVPDSLRHAFAYASVLKMITLLMYTLQDDERNVRQNLIDTLETVDRGLLLGSSYRKELCGLATSICSLLHCYSVKHFDRNFSQMLCDKIQPVIFPHMKLLAEKECPSLESFLINYFKPHYPVKLKGCMDHWPALKKWDNVNYICEKIGPRLVPIEIGSSYTSSDWSQKLMTVEAFIDQFFSSPQKQIGYLAQHQLFNQIPELLDDICVPDYCTLSENYDGDATGTDVNAWFGPANTVSPLHYDPKHNLLAQVVGRKRIFLISPQWSENMYPFDDLLLFNTAQINLENVDYGKFPKFANTEVFECNLEAGEMLYIPPKWWHHVRALSISFSVSFWW